MDIGALLKEKKVQSLSQSMRMALPCVLSDIIIIVFVEGECG